MNRALLPALAALALTAVACGASDGSTGSVDVASTNSAVLTSTTVVAASTSTAPAPSSTSTTVVAAARPVESVDRLVDTTHGRLHLRCVGEGGTTVLLVAGFEEGRENWATVEAAVEPTARVCSYDRFGTGTSDPPPATQTFRTQADALHEMLDVADEPGPYVVVGHSFGGAEAVTFAAQYPAEVVGLLLVDASPVTWPAALAAVATGDETGAKLHTFGVGLADPLANREHLDAVSAFAEVADITSLGSLPMIVMTAEQRQTPGLDPAEAATLQSTWNLGQEQWAALSTVGRVVTVADTSHHIQIDQPEVVVDAIVGLVPAAS